MEREKIVNYANKLLNKYNINIFSNEIESYEIINRIAKEKKIEKFDYEKLKNIEEYIDTKIKMQVIKDDYIFLAELANNLELQKIRKSDESSFKTISFKIKDINNNEYVFLTRKYLNEYIRLNSNNFNNPTIMELNTQRNVELEKLLEIIKRNF